MARVRRIVIPNIPLQKTRTGKPCGDDDFYDKIKSLTGMDYKNKKAGRPKRNENEIN
jgi:hypothetical protein